MLKKILGIDYGKTKVGLAIGDRETRMAFGYGVLVNDKDLLQKIAEIIEKENISKVIIGVASGPTPGHATGQAARPNRNADGPRSLGNRISKLTGVEVEYQDEMFTTQQAQRNLIEKGVKGIKKFDDQEAARLILQGWLDKNQ
jgi:putative Holliday junction resolvase